MEVPPVVPPDVAAGVVAVVEVVEVVDVVDAEAPEPAPGARLASLGGSSSGVVFGTGRPWSSRRRRRRGRPRARAR